MMICPPELRPELYISDAAWDALADREFLNIAVPLLNEPVEFEGRAFWSGAELLMVTGSVAAFASIDGAARMMPYGELFDVVKRHGSPQIAQIYSVFFERAVDGRWQMMYRLMNVARILERDASAMPGWADDGLPCSSWSLASTETCDWLTMREMTDHFCPLEGMSGKLVEKCIERELLKVGQTRMSDVRIHPLPAGRAVAVPTTSCASCAILMDLRAGRPISRLVMNDPSYLVERFWSLTGKLFITRQESMMLTAIKNESRHFALALCEARERVGAAGELTAAAFCF